MLWFQFWRIRDCLRRVWPISAALFYDFGFISKASSYLESKGLNIETWIEGVKEGKKGDVLALYGLNVLLEIHTICHLKNGQTWTTLHSE